MTRLIDADALIKTLNEENIPVDVRVNYEIMNAPTIEPFTDNISRSQAIKGVSEWATDILHQDRLVKEDAIHILESLPSAEQVTGKLNNPDDSLLTADSEDCKEQKSKLDLISRQAVIEFVKNSYYNLAENMDDVWAIVHDVEQLPSAEVEDRFYIKIYADDEPSAKAEKLYQICGETQNREVAEWLKEYFPSAPDSRQRGEWVRKYDGHINCYWYECDQCGEYRPRNQFGHEYNANFCPNCGADMRGEEE